MTDQHADLDGVNEALDGVNEEISEAFVEKPERDWDADARENGWKPKDEWHGDPDGWRDAKEFVKRGDEIFGFIKRDRDRLAEKNTRIESDRDDRLRRMESQYIGLLERQKTQHEADIKGIAAGQRKAVEEGDTATYDALTTQREALGAVPSVPSAHVEADAALTQWYAANPWFRTDKVMHAVAETIAGNVAQAGGDVHAQIQAAEKEVRQRFPEKFEQPKVAVETGAQPLRPKPKAKGVGLLPPEARAGFKECVRLGMYGPGDIEKYAESYWRQE